MRKFHSRIILRSRSGSLASLFIAVLVLVTFLIGAFSVDLGHIQLVTEQLQNATDAGALAGAQDLFTNLPNAEQSARTVCAKNIADGRSVSSSTPGVTVEVYVTAPTTTTPGSVEVKGSMLISHLFGPMFGRNEDTIVVDSVAGTSGNLFQIFANQLFPLAVSIDTYPDGGSPLSEHKVGDVVTFDINSQRRKNAAFTSFTESTANARYISEAISQILGLSEVEPGFIPSVSIGDYINLNNGVVGQSELARGEVRDRFLSLDYPLILPVIEGDPAYTRSRPIIGFIAFRPSSVSFGNKNGYVEGITGQIVGAQVRGISGPAGPMAQYSEPLSDAIVGPVQLIR